jgi:hypothetical protein
VKTWVHGARLALGVGILGVAPFAFAASRAPAGVNGPPFAAFAAWPLTLAIIAIPLLLVLMLVAETLAAGRPGMKDVVEAPISASIAADHRLPNS